MKLCSSLYKLAESLNAIEPDRQLILNSSNQTLFALDINIIIAQFKWCLVNEDYTDCYRKLLKILNSIYGEEEVNALMMCYKKNSLLI